MKARCLSVLLTALAIVAVIPDAVAGQTTPWGAPDLQGIWDFRTITPLERPSEALGQTGSDR